ncbi:MAG: PD-(D/E)XK nuclease family protein [Paludibacteraceae bacterium]|nr:PD-(D/E)XK nuclease family protein [Paludibacteraceae bacterium]
MRHFIDALAENAIQGYGKNIDLSGQTYVFPNRRAGLFFTRALSRLSRDGRVIILPHVTDINRFVEEQSTLRRADDTELIIWLYKAYTIVAPSDTHQLKSFIELGTKILHDFNEIDKYLVDAQTLFQNINDLSGLTANTDESIRHFYDTLLAKPDDTPLLFHQRFSMLWNIMYPLYETFQTLLRGQGIAYEGMFFRDLCNAEDSGFSEAQIIFAGFNILTESEKRVIEKFTNRRMVFDYNALQRKDTDFDYHSANIRDFRFNIPSDINEYPCMTSAEQGDSLRRAMSDIARNNDNVEENTAIVLADESMLIETLSNLRDIKKINVTMGYPLASTQIANFVNLVIRMQLSIEIDSDGIEKIYHKPLIDLLTHPYLKLYLNDESNRLVAETTQIISNIRKNNISRIPTAQLQSLDKQLFARNHDTFGYLLQVLNRLKESIDRQDNPATDTEVIDHHFVRQYTTQIENLRNHLLSADISADETETYALIRRITRGMKVQFRGEPLQGLQVMGLLECRLLDFDNIIFVGFNDQFVPGNNGMTNSIIPYSLRKPYGLPSHEITNSIYAYNFYRMLHRCRRLDLIYTTATNEDSKTEVSRFYNQLRYIHGITMTNANAAIAHTIDQSKNLFTPYFEQTPTAHRLTQISASSLKKFITCPLRFYYEYLLNLREQDDIDDTISDSTFGKLLHRALELYYKKVGENHLLTAEQSSKLITTFCEQAYAEVVRQRHNRGYDILAFNSLKTLVRRIINFDESRAKFYDVQTEVEFTTDFEGFKIKAIIDRIDRMESGEYVVIDYKTSVDDTKASLDRMFSIDKVRKYDLEVMQVLLYCAILRRTPDFANARLIPQLFKIYTLSKEKDKKDFTPIQTETSDGVMELTDYEVIMPEFEARMAETLTDLRKCLDTPSLFLRTAENRDNCKYCPFHELCLTAK